MTASAKLRITLFLFCFLISGFCFQTPAFAACFNPAGNTGETFYSNEASVLEYCNGGNWIPMGAVSGPPGGPLNGLIHYWKFDETSGTSAADSAGTATATLYSTASFAAAKINNGMSLANDTNDHGAQVASSPADILGISALTMSVWMKPAIGSTLQIGKTQNGTGFLDFGPNNGAYIFFEVSTNGTDKYGLCADPNDGLWHHVVMVFDGTQTGNAARLKAYLDGVQQTLSFTGTIPATTPTSSTPAFQIGNVDGTPSVGTVDDVRVYNRALSAAEIWTLYNNTVQAVTGLTAEWKLDDGTGTTAVDSTGNGNTGTLGNSPTWAAGNTGGALTFVAASTQYVLESPDTAGLRLSDSTISAWVNLSATPTSGNVFALAGRDDSTGHTNYGFFVDNNNFSAGLGWVINFNTTADFTNHYAKYTTAISTGTWYHLTGVYNSKLQTETLYLNGVNVASSSVSGFTPTTVAGSAWIGAEAGFYVPSSGTIDDVRIYNRALSAPEVQAIYNGSKSCSSPVGQAGTIMYNGGTRHVLQTCGGGVWKPAGPVPGTGGGTCSSPSGNEGDTLFNKDYHALQYCDGAVWRVGGGNTPIGGLIGWWNFDESSGTTAKDSSGNGNDGTLTNGPTWTTSGKINGALAVGSTTAYANMGQVLQGLTTMTVSAWVNPTAVSSHQMIVDHTDTAGAGTTGWGFDMGFLASGDIHFAGMVPGQDVERTSSAGVLTAGVWTHVLATWDGSLTAANIHLYVNGVETTYAATTNGTTSHSDGTTSLRIPAATSAMVGSIDDVRIYNRQLSAAEVARLYNGAP